MITQETVFVLGAGASKVFGYPTGRELLDNVYVQLTQGTPTRNLVLNTTPFSPRNIDIFADALLHSGQSSVDAFLEHQTQFMDIGKAAMAAVLVPSEVHDRLWFRLEDKNWMLYLYNMLGSEFEKFHEHKLSFITYNYDRTLEHFLMTSLCNTYGKSIQDCKPIMPEIIHLHGRLDYLPWEVESGRAYGDVEINVKRMTSLIKDIKIVHENPADGRDKDFKRALELLEAARRIYFLGFGYGRINLERLEGKFAGRSDGTAYNLTGQECASIRQMTHKAIKLWPDWDCMQFMRNVVLFD